MTVPTQPVTFKLSDFGGPSVAGVKVTAQLDDYDYTAAGVFVSTKPVTGVTDVNGQVVLQLFPNAVSPSGLGTRGTKIKVTAQPPQSRGIRVEAAIPNAPCNLVDYLLDQEPSGLAASELAAQQAQSYRDQTQALIGAASTTQITAWALAEAFRIVTVTRNGNGAVTSATIVWPDGTPGVYTADVLSAAFPGATDAWHATYAATTPKTVTQPAVTRDSSGFVTAQPAITIL